MSAVLIVLLINITGIPLILGLASIIWWYGRDSESH
jgi:hypothetical protein